VLATPTAQMPAVEGRSPGYQIQSQNPLLTTYPGDLGGKTGFTNAARHTFVTAAERGGRRLVVTVMDTENRPVQFSDQAVRLLDWGFAVPAGTRGVGTLVAPGEVEASPSSSTTAPWRASHPATAGASASSPADGFPVVPVTLAGVVVLIVATTIAGRRRAARPLPVRRPGGGAARPTPPGGGSPSTPP
jgi:D-alanyl-D-alanine carboxypeptidase (penicillin-binding protein 5/6)